MRWVLFVMEWLALGVVFATLFVTTVALTRMAEALEQLASDWHKAYKEEEQ